MLKKLLGFALLAAAIAFAPPALATDIALDGNLRGLCGTASASGNGTAATATLANKCGVLTSEALTAPTASLYTLTLTNTVATTTDLVLWALSSGTNTAGTPTMVAAEPGSGTIVFTVRQPTTTSFNGTIKIRYFVIKP